MDVHRPAMGNRQFNRQLLLLAGTALLIPFCLLAQSRTAISQDTLPDAQPALVGMSAEKLARIDELVEEGLEQKRMPGCVVVVGRKGKIVYRKAFGYRQLEPEKVPMTVDTVFDMASITKPMATATSAMVLLEQGKLRLRDRVSQYIPEFANGGKEEATVMHLLTHQAGFVPDNALADYLDGREQAFKNIYALSARYPPSEKFVYSDVGFILLDDLIERQSGMNVHEFSHRYIFEPLGMNETGYLPSEELRERAVTTQERESRWMRGEVHDPRAYAIGGVAGHAGLFSTANDIAIYAQMMLQKGTYKGKRILSEATVELMTSAYSIEEPKKTSIRGLGWDKLSGYSSNRGENMSARAFGHGGFTGTVLWMDPEHDLFFIFLSNRVHPNGKGSVNRLAGRIATVAVGAIDDRQDDHTLHSQILREPVKVGIDVLEAENFQALRGQRLGLITNQTGVNSDGRSTIEILGKSDTANLVALFSPEHGLQGLLDQSQIADSVDSKTGLKIHSLYGKSRKPTAEQLEDVDTLVFDIQDIGCRFYTYISTMGLAMEAANENDKRFVVLDRPNPIGGKNVTGSLVDSGLESFVAFHSMPIQHGMTVGEIAKLLKHERNLDSLKLEVVQTSGWSREQFFDETGLEWINPSPNMRNLDQAILYPGIGLWETTNISVGRGTDTPFQILGAPWIDCQELARELNHSQIPGVKFTPRKFVPSASKYTGEECEGVQISVTHRKRFDSMQCGITLACILRHLYPDDWKLDQGNRLLCNESILNSIKSGQTAEEILKLVNQERDRFLSRREQHLIYGTR